MTKREQLFDTIKYKLNKLYAEKDDKTLCKLASIIINDCIECPLNTECTELVQSSKNKEIDCLEILLKLLNVGVLDD